MTNTSPTQTPKKPKIHPSAPRGLIQRFEQNGFNYNALSRDLGVNKGILYKLLSQGIEPASEEIRRKCLFPSYRIRKRIHRSVSQPRIVKPQPAYIKWWRRQSKTFRKHVIKKEYSRRKK